MSNSYDYIIVGAGPAGIQMGYFLEKKQANYLIIEKGDSVATFFRTYPRQRGLISINKVYCGNMDEYENVLRYDWNSILLEGDDDIRSIPYFRDFSKEYYPKVDSLLKYLETVVDKLHIRIQLNTTVYNITKNKQNKFEVNIIQDGVQTLLEASKVIIATGLTPKVPSNLTLSHVPSGKELFYYSSMPLEPCIYHNKNILIIGSGNAAFETANYLNSFTNSINLIGSEKLAYNTHYPGYLRSINMPIIDSYYLKSKVVLNWSTTVNTEEDSRLIQCLEGLDNGSLWRSIDIVIICAGFIPYLGYVDPGLEIEKNKKGFPILTPFFESVSCKDLYFVGSLTQDHDYKKGTSAFIHGFRYNARILRNYLYAGFEIENYITIRDAVTHYFKHINTSSCLFHRFDYIGDALLINDKNDITYINEIPELVITQNHIHDIVNVKHKYICFIKLGYNPDKKMYPNFTQLQAGQTMLQRNESVFIHPIITIYVNNNSEYEKLHMIHLPEEAMNVFVNTELYCQPIYSLVEILSNHSNITATHLKNFDNFLNIIARR